LGVTLILGNLGVWGFKGGLVRIAKMKLTHQIYRVELDTNHIYIYPIILSPIRGGAIIGVFMIQALKEAFMGYVGLLLNAPYKIDSMMG
jgi:hypothetical protein